jgi:hypothetical protein
MFSIIYGPRILGIEVSRAVQNWDFLTDWQFPKRPYDQLHHHYPYTLITQTNTG